MKSWPLCRSQHSGKRCLYALAPDGTASKEVLRDLVHLSAKGYAIWAEEIEPMVAELMGEK